MQGRFTKGRLFQNIPVIGNTAYVNMLNIALVKKNHYKIIFLMYNLHLVLLQKDFLKLDI